MTAGEPLLTILATVMEEPLVRTRANDVALALGLGRGQRILQVLRVDGTELGGGSRPAMRPNRGCKESTAARICRGIPATAEIDEDPKLPK